MDVYYIPLIIVTLFKAKTRVMFELDLTYHLVLRKGVVYLFWGEAVGNFRASDGDIFLGDIDECFLIYHQIFGVSLSSAGEYLINTNSVK